MKFKSEPDNDVRDMDISSMSDVVFQLLIFFLVATNIQQEESQLKVAIPVDQQATEAQAVDLAEEVVIDIYDNGEVYWNGQYVDSPDSVDMPELKNILYELKQAYPNQSVTACCTDSSCCRCTDRYQTSCSTHRQLQTGRPSP